MLKEVHKEECGNHVGDLSIAQKVLCLGYYLLIINHDSIEWLKGVRDVKSMHLQ